MAQDIKARVAADIFNMISFALAKGVRAQIVSRLPTNILLGTLLVSRWYEASDPGVEWWLKSEMVVAGTRRYNASDVVDGVDTFIMYLSLSIEHEVLNLDSAGTRLQRRHLYLKINVSDKQQIQFRRISLTGFLAQSVGSSNAITLESLYLLVVITGTSQSRQHESRKTPTKSLFDVGSSRISIIIVNTKKYHSDVLAVITRIMRRTL
ncbi:hypothetical protein Tco_1034191 [Tanacetum coccineum]